MGQSPWMEKARVQVGNGPIWRTGCANAITINNNNDYKIYIEFDIF